LAMAQSLQVAKNIEAMSPDVKVQLVGIETQGDRIQDVALGKIEGKEFFVAELDEALSSGLTDLSVHSLKDLSLDRPSNFLIAAVPKREDSRDVIIFNRNVSERLKEGFPVRIGTSSPRRLELLPSFLTQALSLYSKPRFDWIEIRGNVNTRLSRLFENEESSKKLDGVVLAAAGLNRLWKDVPGQKVLSEMLDGRVLFMILPLSEVPSAPGQGALAVECRSNDHSIFEVLQKLHDPITAKQVEVERSVLGEFGGGCHQRFGASQFQVGELSVTRISGRSAVSSSGKGEMIDEWRWSMPEKPNLSEHEIWDGHAYKNRKIIPLSISTKDQERLMSSKIWWVSHINAWTDQIHELFLKRTLSGGVRIWTAGVKTGFHLAKKGVWVEGSSDSFGILSENKLKFMNLDALDDAPVLTHQDASSRETSGRGLPTYQSISLSVEPEMNKNIGSARWIYWSSFAQYEALKDSISASVIHSCGTGKTATELKKIGINPVIFPNHAIFVRWNNLK